MAKFLKKVPKRSYLPWIAAVLVVILGLWALMTMDQDHNEGPAQVQTPTGTDEAPATQPRNDQPSVTVPVTRQPSATDPLPGLEYPVMLEDGALVIESLLQYDGINPDCGLEEGKNIASVMLMNASDVYLEKAELTLTLTDGTVATFTVTELPAGKTVMAFATDNTAMEADALCAGAECIAEWNPEITPLPEDVSVSVEDLLVTVTNNTGRRISSLVIYCRCPLEEEYFGGIAYPYTIRDLSAGESADVEAWDCILGMAEVVRIAVNED